MPPPLHLPTEPLRQPPSRARRALPALAAAGCAAIGSLLGWGAGTAGATSTVPSTIALVSQTPIVSSTAGLKLGVAVSSQLSRRDLGLQVTLYSQVTERGYFEQTVDNNTAGFTPIDQPSLLPLDTKGLLSPGGDAVLDLPVSAPGLPGASQRPPRDGALLALPCSESCAGIYPLQVSLEDTEDATTLDSFITYLVLAPSSVASPLRFSFVLPIGSAPATGPTGRAEPAPADESEIEQLLPLLTKYSSVSVSLDISPQFVSALEAAAARDHKRHQLDQASDARHALAVLRRLVALPNVEVESDTYAPVDTAGLAGSHLGDELAAQFQMGRSVLATLGLHPSPHRYVATSPLGRRGLELLQRAGVNQLLVPSDSVAAFPPTRWDYPVWAPFIAKQSQDRLEADASDAYLEQHLASGADPVLRANQLLSDLAILYFVEQPPAPRGVTLLAPLGWRPTTRFISTLLRGLSSDPLVATDSLSAFFAQVPPGSAETPLLVRALEAPAIPRSDDISAGTVAAARVKLRAVAAMLPRGAARTTELKQAVLLGESAGLSPKERAAYLAAPGRELAREARRITLPGGKTITITSLSARVPISVYSSAPTPLRVELVVASGDLSFKRHDYVFELRPKNNTKEISLSARTAGDFPLELEVRTVEGDFPLASGRLLIRSTAISGVAVALTAGAAVFLLAWWGRSVLRRKKGHHVRQDRPRRRPALPAETT